MIQFDFDDRHRDEQLDRTLPWFARVLIAQFAFDTFVGVVLLPWLVLLVLFWPRPTAPPQAPPDDEPIERFVLMEPLRETPPVRPRERVERSDLDRRSQTRERPPEAENPMPLARGNTTERVEAVPEERAKGPETEQPSPQPQPQPQPEEQIARNESPTPALVPRSEPSRRPVAGALGEAVRNLQRYTQNHTFNNPQGGNTDSNAAIQFDSKGVDFGPWLRRFVSQVKRNWFVPLSAMSFRGRVVLQFNIHRNGRITDVHIAQPSDIDSFNRAAYNAILGSNPTEPLPPEYPEDKVFFTVTFYYNEQPGS